MLTGHLKLGTVEETKRRIGSKEFCKWLAYFRLRPFGDELQCVLGALQMIVSASAFGGKLEWNKAYLAQVPDDPNRPQSPEEMQSLLKSIARIK